MSAAGPEAGPDLLRGRLNPCRRRVDIGTLITKNPQVKGGKPCIAGTGTTVLAIVERYESGLSPQDIKDQLPELDLDGIFAALAYAHANRAEIDEWLRLDREAHGSLFGPAA